MSARLRLTRDLLRNGTHLLVTDVDNVFSRHVPLRGPLCGVRVVTALAGLDK